jgi:hypothetical protein
MFLLHEEVERMADEQRSNALQQKIDTGLSFQQKEMVSRADWGVVKFEQAGKDLQRIFTVLANLKILPLENLPDQAIDTIHSQIDRTIAVLNSVDTFTVEQASPAQVRDSLVSEVHQQADALYTHATPWIPYLAYLRGDVETNIKALTRSVEKARGIVDEAKTSIEDRQSEIDNIVTKAREASAAAGAAVFTKDFDDEAKTLSATAKKWLHATIVAGVLTTFLAFLAFFLVESGLDTGEIIQKSAARLAVLAIFFTGTLWCGRIYKALLHQSSINRHRALSLQTFQAFSSAASDDGTKDAVLMEATRAVFGNVPTGFLDQSGASTPQGLQVVEIARQYGSE